jgi:hypothetical protein
MGIPAPSGVDAAGLPNKGDQANAAVYGTLTAVGPGDPFAFRGPMNLAVWASYKSSLTTTANSLTATIGTAGAVAAGNAINSVNVPPGTTVGVISSTTITLALPAYTYFCTGFSTSSTYVTLPPGSNVNQLLGSTVTAPSTAEGLTIPSGTTVAAIVQADVAGTINAPGTPGIISLSAVPTAVPSDTAQHPLRFALTAEAVTVTGADANATYTGASIVYSGTIQLERSFDGGSTWLVCNLGGGGTLAQYSLGTPVSVVFGEPERNVLYRVNCTAYTSGTINYRFSQTGGAAESLAIGPLSNG